MINQGINLTSEKFDMKLNKIILAIGLGAAAIGVATAAPLTKTITVGATINDAIYVSLPDGTSWYSGTQSLDALDGYKQSKFAKTLPVRVYSSGNAFNISLEKKLVLAGNNGYSMTDTKVEIADSASATGPVALSTNAYKVKQTTASGTAYDDVYNITISANAPTAIQNGASLNGTYSGDLALVFESSSITP